MSHGPDSMPVQGSRKRGVRRHAVEMNAVLRPLGRGAGEGAMVAGVVRDIGLGGCRVELPGPLPKGSLWHVAMRGGVDGERTLVAMVRWGAPSGGRRFQAGLQFMADCSVLGAAGVAGESLLGSPEIAARGPSSPWSVAFNIVAAGALRVAELESVTVRAERDLCVERSIVDCVLEVGGRLDAGGAALVGGRAHVASRAEVAELGSADGRPTSLTVGRSLRAALMLAAIPAVIAQRAAAIERDSRIVARLRARPADSLSTSECEALAGAVQSVEREIGRNERAEAGAGELRARDTAPSARGLSVARMVHPGVTVCTGDSSVRFDRPLPGPAWFSVAESGELLVALAESQRPRPAAEIQGAARMAA